MHAHWGRVDQRTAARRLRASATVGSALSTARRSVTKTRWLTPGVRGIGAASLPSDLGHEVPTALLPRFVASPGGSAAVLGVIEGIADGLAGLARLGGGALADDPDRRRATAIGGYSSVAVLSGLIGAATSIWQVVVLRSAAWTARGLRVPARNALLADATPREAYGRAYGFERMMDNLGAIGGPILALVLVAAFSIRTAILLSIIPGLLATVAIVYAIRHLPKLERRERAPIRLQVRPVIQAGLGRLMLAVSAFELGNVAATLLILRASQLLAPTEGADAATNTALVLYVAYNVAATLASTPAGHLSDRTSPRLVLAVGVAAFLVAYGLFAATGPSAPALLFAFVLAGLGILIATPGFSMSCGISTGSPGVGGLQPTLAFPRCPRQDAGAEAPYLLPSAAPVRMRACS